MVNDRIAWGEQQQIDAETIKGIYDIIHSASLKKQEDADKIIKNIQS